MERRGQLHHGLVAVITGREVASPKVNHGEQPAV